MGSENRKRSFFAVVDNVSQKRSKSAVFVVRDCYSLGGMLPEVWRLIIQFCWDEERNGTAVIPLVCGTFCAIFREIEASEFELFRSRYPNPAPGEHRSLTLANCVLLVYLFNHFVEIGHIESYDFCGETNFSVEMWDGEFVADPGVLAELPWGFEEGAVKQKINTETLGLRSHWAERKKKRSITNEYGEAVEMTMVYACPTRRQIGSYVLELAKEPNSIRWVCEEGAFWSNVRMTKEMRENAIQYNIPVLRTLVAQSKVDEDDVNPNKAQKIFFSPHWLVRVMQDEWGEDRFFPLFNSYRVSLKYPW